VRSSERVGPDTSDFTRRIISINHGNPVTDSSMKSMNIKKAKPAFAIYFASCETFRKFFRIFVRAFS